MWVVWWVHGAAFGLKTRTTRHLQDAQNIHGQHKLQAGVSHTSCVIGLYSRAMLAIEALRAASAQATVQDQGQ